MKFKKIIFKELPEDKTIWLFNEKTKFLRLGVYTYLPGDGWFFACQDNTDIWLNENNEIQIEGYIDDYDFTHWAEITKIEL